MTVTRANAPVFALPTEWHGITFRSRLEARWAIFFDTARIRWLYEPEGYNLPSGNYLPDFQLPELRTWIEVKPEGHNERAETLMGELCQATEMNGFVAYGYPDPDRVESWGPAGGCGNYTGGELILSNGDMWDNGYAFCECFICGGIGIEFEARSGRLKCKHGGSDKSHNGGSPTLRAAYTAGWSARFENGVATWQR
jgi:hypothetical protein